MTPDHHHMSHSTVNHAKQIEQTDDMLCSCNVDIVSNKFLALACILPAICVR